MREAPQPSVLEADRRLVARCLEGEPAARRQLVEHCHASVRQTIELLAARRGDGILPADVDDAIQQAFFAFLSHDLLVLRRWRGQARLKTYLNRVAERVASRHFMRTTGLGRRFRLVFTGEVGDVDEPTSLLDRITTEAQQAGALEAEPALEDALVRAEVQADLRAAILERLTDKGRDYYRYLFVEELDVSVICELESTNANNVYQWKNRILREAAAVLAERG